MNNTFKTILTAGIVAVLIVLGFRLVGNQSADLGASAGITRYPNSGLAARYLSLSATPNTAVAGTDGAILAPGGITLGTGGTAISARKCSTATWNPSAVNPTTTTSTVVTVTGAALGDIASASIDLDQQSLSLTANVTTTDTIVARLSQPDTDLATNVDLATTTLKVCYTH